MSLMTSPAHWTVELELLTPAFIGGVRPRAVDPVTPLRATALRGVLRQWFRYALGAVLAPSSLEDKEALDGLRKLETELFGSTERGSALVIGPPAGGRVRDFPVPDARKSPGQRYLGYGLFDGSPPQCLETPGAGGSGPVRFPIGLRRLTRSADAATAKSNAELEPVLAATLWLWSHFGGIGARGRRGWGAVEVTNVEASERGVLPWAGSAFGRRFETLGALLEGLSKGLDEVLRVFGAFCGQRGFRLPVRDQMPLVELRTVAGIEALRALPVTRSDPLEALELVGRLFQDFRSTLARSRRQERPHSDYFDVKSAIQGKPNAPASVVRAAFGLPLPFYFRSLGGRKDTAVPMPSSERGLEKWEPDRLPSPLLLRPHRLTNDARGRPRFAITLIDLAEAPGTDHLNGHGVRLSRGGQRAQRAPDGQIVADFMRWAIEQAAHYDEGLR